MHDTATVNKKKVCKDCTEEKALSAFYSHRKKPGGTVYHASYCKACAVLRSRTDDRRRSESNFLRLWLWFRDNPCTDCGEDNPLCLELDHVRGHKVDAVANLMRGPWPVIAAELKKCDARCGNCHKIKTAASLGHFATESLRDYVTEWPRNKKAFYLYETQETES